MFPSPYGDYGSYHAMYCNDTTTWNLLFPSPYGDYGSYLGGPGCFRRPYHRCFRPLTGIMVLIRQTCAHWGRNYEQGFRPLTGIMVLICDGLYTVHPPEKGLFPSPYGDYGSYREDGTATRYKTKRVSVPLRGLWFLSQQACLRSHQALLKVSVPLRGLWFLSAEVKELILDIVSE